MYQNSEAGSEHEALAAFDVQDVHKFKEDVQKFQEEYVHKKVQSLIEQLRQGDVPEGFVVSQHQPTKQRRAL